MPIETDIAIDERPAKPDSQYLRHIDGLRALAIIPVVLYHLFPSWCPGGFAGVDVFFVISGFLITRGIVSDLNARRFSIADFYTRRIRRILPAYFVVIAFVLMTLPFVYSWLGSRSVFEAAIYSAFYAANIYFDHAVGYFDLAARNNSLLHLWSLGVEEQFYLVAPAVIWILWTLRKSFLLYSFAFLFVASLLFSSISVLHGDARFAFFMLPSRAWQLLAGAMTSQLHSARVRGNAYANPLVWTGLTFVLAPYAFYSAGTPFPGMAAIPSVLGASILIFYGDRGFVNKLLSWNPAVWIGRASYSLYLWHWPIIILLSPLWSIRRIATAILAMGAATCLSYRYVETPFRGSTAFGPRNAFSFLIAGSCLISGISWLAVSAMDSENDGLPRHYRGWATWVMAEESGEIGRSRCSIEDLKAESRKVLFKIGNPGSAPTFVLWGDSFAEALLPGMDVIASEYGKGGFYINLKQGFTLETEIGGAPFHPEEEREPVLRWLESRPDLTDVYLVNHWFFELRNEADVRETIGICQRLVKAGKHVWFFNNLPGSNENAIRLVSWGWHIDRAMGAMDVATYERRAHWQTQLTGELTRRNLATVVPIDRAFLDGSSYYTTTDTQTFYGDEVHLIKIGSLRAVRFVAPMLWGASSKAPAATKF